jgi:hypothetical protein
MAVTAMGKNRIMIYGPKDDGTYVVEFKTEKRRCAGGFHPNGAGSHPVLSRADAIWAVRAGGALAGMAINPLSTVGLGQSDRRAG